MIREFDYSCVICTIQFRKRDDPSYILERHCLLLLVSFASQSKASNICTVNHVLANTCYRIHICRALVTFNILSLQIFLQYHFPLLLIFSSSPVSPPPSPFSSPPTLSLTHPSSFLTQRNEPKHTHKHTDNSVHTSTPAQTSTLTCKRTYDPSQSTLTLGFLQG